jgi:uncharacterized protein
MKTPVVQHRSPPVVPRAELETDPDRRLIGRPRLRDRVTQVLRTAPAQAAVFVGLVYLIVLATPLLWPDAPGMTLPMLAMATPVAVVGLITLFATPRGERVALWRSLGLRHLGLRSWPAALAIPVLIVLVIPWGVAALLGFATFSGAGPSLPDWLINLVLFGLVMTTFLALGEEIGWRGYLLPRMQALLPRRHAALAVGFIHGIFHLPLMLLTTTYNDVGNRAVVCVVVVAAVTAAGVLYAWIRDRSGSVWPVAIAHSAVNTLIFNGAGLFVIASPLALAYTAGESGLATLLAISAAAIFLLVRGSTWAAPQDAATPTEVMAS